MMDYGYLKSLRMADEILFNDNSTSANFEFGGSFYILDSEQFFKLFNDQYEEKLRSDLTIPLSEIMEKNYTDIYAVTDIYVDADIDGSIHMSVVLSVEDTTFRGDVTLDKTALEILRDKVTAELDDMSLDGLTEEDTENVRKYISDFKDNVQKFIDNPDRGDYQPELEER